MEIRAATENVDLEGTTFVAGVLEGGAPLPGSEEAVEGVDATLMEAAGFEGKTGQTLRLPHPEAATLLLVGLGEEADYGSLRDASGDAARMVKTEIAVSLLGKADVEGAIRAVVEGTLLGGYRYRDYKTDDEPQPSLETIHIVGAGENAIKDWVIIAEATNLARDWINTPARDLSPEVFAGLIETAAVAAGASAEVWDRSRIEEEGLGGLLGVAAGSDRDPRVVTITYKPANPKTHLALVGKGITFDSGGLSIKASNYMEEMKVDMSGAAAVVAATVAIARLGLPLQVTCITPLTDNAIGGDATRPGDVLRPVEGPTIEVLNTDAEGRLILADGLGLARRGEPDLIVDVATLTGAARVALGDQIAAVFASDSEVAGRVLAAAGQAGEEFWEMPLFKKYRKSLDSNIADIKNISGSRYGGAIVAAVFLSEYAGDGPWAHIDIAGPAIARENGGDQVKGGSGFGVRTLVELARAVSESG
ncbi:MAG: leucyl aminopeptidase [Acidimicrobiia bacterium]